jgi:putative sugar O-methyltransferase
MADHAIEEARAHYFSATGLPYPEAFELSERWSHWSQLSADKITAFGSTEEAIHYAQRCLGFEHRHSAKNSKSHWAQYDDALRSDFPDQTDLIRRLTESPLSHPATVADFRGRPMSNVMFWHAYEFLTTYCRVGDVETVAEIGGGIGVLARLWLENSSNLKTYLLTDFPESLFYAELYLSHHFPAINLHYITEDDGLEALDKGTIILCPAQLADKLKGINVDFAINSGSMQEMTEGAMLWWCDWLEAGEINYFYSLNYGLQPIHARRGGSANWMCPRLGPFWDALLLRLDPPIVREQSLRHYREVLYRRTELQDTKERAERASALLAAHSTPVSINREQSVLELLDALRLSPSINLVMRLIQILGTLFDYRPKELIYVCRVGLELSDATDNELKILTNLLSEISEIAAEEHSAAVPSTPLF